MRWWLVSVTLAASCASPPPDWCTDKAPDEACFRAKRPVDDPRLVRAVEVAEAYMSRHPPTGLEWGWEEGVLATALSELHRVTRDEALERTW